MAAEILEAKSYRQAVKAGAINPFETRRIVICSYQFAAGKADTVRSIPWDLVVVDEAHRLRNVYKPENKTARTLRDALGHARKVFLTATPLQNTLLELYGLRLPYGRKTGVEAVDRLNIIAHDKFQEVVDEAGRADSPTSDLNLLIETKKAADVEAEEVQVKAKAAISWCAHASEYAARHGQKPWRYLLIRHDAVASNVTLKHLLDHFGRS